MLGGLEHDPEKWKPVFGKRSCSNKELERDDDSKKSHPALMPTAPLGLLGELQPLARQLFVLALELEIANVARELPAFGRVGAEFFGTGLHVALFDDFEPSFRSSAGRCAGRSSGAQPPYPPCLSNSVFAASPM